MYLLLVAIPGSPVDGRATLPFTSCLLHVVTKRMVKGCII